jgi:hypothetical protein
MLIRFILSKINLDAIATLGTGKKAISLKILKSSAKNANKIPINQSVKPNLDNI